MKAQHVGTSPSEAAKRGLICLVVALACAMGLAGDEILARAQTATASPAPSAPTVGVGLQRSTHEALGPSYAAAKLGNATGAALYSETTGRAAVTVASYEPEPTYEPEPASEPVWAAEADVSAEHAAYDGGTFEPVEAPAYEEPVPSEPAYDEPAYEEPAPEPSYEEPAYDWYTVQASAYSVETNGGTTTASGTPLDDWSLTVASPWVPLGSVVEIEYGGMTVQAVVTDRGPYVSGRDLDLTPGVIGAFGFSDIYDWGVRTVSYRVL